LEKKNSIFIATSLDGYIADRDGGIEWLDKIPNPEQIDMGYHSFMSRIDALIMGRNTFKKVLSFGISWPFEKPVFVWSRTLKEVPNELAGKVELIAGQPKEILERLYGRGLGRIYIDGGKTIQSFLQDDLIDEITITKIPVILGAGIPLFGELSQMQTFSLVKSEVFLNQIVQDTYIRKR